MILTSAGNVTISTIPGRDYHASGLGTWNGATVVLQTLLDGAWHTVPDGSWTEDFEIVRTNGAGGKCRLVLSGEGASTSLSLNLIQLPLEE